MGYRQWLPGTLQALLLAVLLSTLPGRTRALENDFSAYPSGSQACLTTSADASGCTGDTGQQLNSCLCKNGGNFIYATAECVAKSSASDLKTVYAMLQSNCAGTGITIAVSEEAFLAQAAAATSTTTSTTMRTTTTAAPTTTTGTTGTSTTDFRTEAATTTTTMTTTTSSSSAAGPTSTGTADPLSTGAKIGIGAGIGLGSAAVVLAGVFIWVYHRRRRQGGDPKDHPYMMAGSPTPGAYSATFAQQPGPPHPPGTGIPLDPMSAGGYMSPGGVSSLSGTMMAGTYKPEDGHVRPPSSLHHRQGSSSAVPPGGQPLLAELGTTPPHQRAPVEIYTPVPVELPAVAWHGHNGHHAELESPSTWQSLPPGQSPYSAHERTHF
ncbi:hypothetical protein JX266_004967 [Neoarthrinium moseri]|uniref:uncharacterized protein n=1 Tax=Neoarthrinium moseri TaxID=1658444 RepID=UPI001FDE7E08|nr:uncharacterized protein JN550_008863 [Neoarthrinium moseri]KAI1849472.1 hypothetical protein JX266_004967 [Neoarthrinium moseri]KAI1864576.1 hypothetical protein JN550_008863 [Neoarthrinium moseri]